jgi:hypothetical protein
MMLWHATPILLLQLENNDCISATYNAGNKTSTQRFAYQILQKKRVGRFKAAMMDNIVNYVKAGTSIVLKFEVFAFSEE